MGSIRTYLYNDLRQAKFNDFYLSFYLDVQKERRKSVTALSLIFSSTGVFGWAFWQKFSLVACILLAIIQIAKLVSSEFLASEIDLNHLGELRIRWNQLFNKYERLWLELESQKKSDEEVIEIFYKIKEDNSGSLEIENRVDIKHNKKVLNKANEQTNQFMKRYQL